MGILDAAGGFVKKLGSFMDDSYKTHHYGENWREQADFLRRFQDMKLASEQSQIDLERGRIEDMESRAEEEKDRLHLAKLAAAGKHYEAQARAGIRPTGDIIGDPEVDREIQDLAWQAAEAQRAQDAVEGAEAADDEAWETETREYTRGKRAHEIAGRNEPDEPEEDGGYEGPKAKDILSPHMGEAKKLYKAARTKASLAGKDEAAAHAAGMRAQMEFLQKQEPAAFEAVYGRAKSAVYGPDPSSQPLQSAMPGRQHPQGDMERFTVVKELPGS